MDPNVKELGSEVLDGRMADWATVALGYPDHPAGQALTQALLALAAKRHATHEARDQSQTLMYRLQLAYTALFGLQAVSGRVLDEKCAGMAAAVKRFVESGDNVTNGLMPGEFREVPTLRRAGVQR